MKFIYLLLRFWVVFVFIGLAGYLAIKNSHAITVSFPPYFTQITQPAYIVYMAFAILGATIAVFFFGWEHLRKSWEVRSLRKKLAQLSPSEPMTKSNKSLKNLEPEQNHSAPKVNIQEPLLSKPESSFES